MSDPPVSTPIGPASPGSTVLDDDWLKSLSWDLYAVHDGIWDPVTDVPTLCTALGLDGLAVPQQKAAVQKFVTLPAWIPAPDEVKTAVMTWLGTPPPAAG